MKRLVYQIRRIDEIAKTLGFKNTEFINIDDLNFLKNTESKASIDYCLESSEDIELVFDDRSLYLSEDIAETASEYLFKHQLDISNIPSTFTEFEIEMNEIMSDVNYISKDYMNDALFYFMLTDYHSIMGSFELLYSLDNADKHKMLEEYYLNIALDLAEKHNKKLKE